MNNARFPGKFDFAEICSVNLKDSDKRDKEYHNLSAAELDVFQALILHCCIVLKLKRLRQISV